MGTLRYDVTEGVIRDFGLPVTGTNYMRKPCVCGDVAISQFVGLDVGGEHGLFAWICTGCGQVLGGAVCGDDGKWRRE